LYEPFFLSISLSQKLDQYMLRMGLTINQDGYDPRGKFYSRYIRAITLKCGALQYYRTA